MGSVALSHAARCQNQLGVAFLASLTVDAFARARGAGTPSSSELGRRGARRAVKFIAQQAAQFIRSLRRVVRAVDAPALGEHRQHRPCLREPVVRLVRGDEKSASPRHHSRRRARRSALIFPESRRPSRLHISVGDVAVRLAVGVVARRAVARHRERHAPAWGSTGERHAPRAEA